jgi:hypothetical protein
MAKKHLLFQNILNRIHIRQAFTDTDFATGFIQENFNLPNKFDVKIKVRQRQGKYFLFSDYK